MSKGARVPLRLIIGLAVAIALDTGLQLVWKTGVAEIPDAASLRDMALSVALNPIFILVILFMATQLVNWLKVLDHADLSYAKPFTSLSYVTVCVLSVLLLGERIAPLQIVGIMVVVAGVWCVSMTKRATLAQIPTEDAPGLDPGWEPVRRPEPAALSNAGADPQ